MVYEIKLTSPKEFYAELKGLEVDAGVRANGEFEGRKSLIFITKHSGKYAIWIRDRSPSGRKNGTFRDFGTYGELLEFLQGTIDRPLLAFTY